MSPVFADLTGLPPLLVLAGEHEVLLDDAARVVESAKRSGTPASLLVGRKMQHDWPLTLPWLEESREAWAAMRQFVDEAAGAYTVSLTARVIQTPTAPGELCPV
jgi:acetyl esterase/lipase